MLAAAAGIRQVIDSQMADLIRKSTIERGYDPRDFVADRVRRRGPGARRLATASRPASPRSSCRSTRPCTRRTAPRARTCASAEHSEPARAAGAGRAAASASTRRWRAASAAQLDARRRAAAQRRFHRWVEARFAGRSTTCACRCRRRSTTRRCTGRGARVRAGVRAPVRARHGLARRRHRVRQFRHRRGRRRASSRPSRCVRRAAQPAPRSASDRSTARAAARWCRRRSTTASRCSRAHDRGPAVIEHPGTTIVVLARPDARASTNTGTPTSLATAEEGHPMNRACRRTSTRSTFEVLNHRLLASPRRWASSTCAARARTC